MSVYLSPLCKGCTHWRTRGYEPNAATNTGSCDAFPTVPNGIPVEIWHSVADHRTPYPGDHGITFAPTGPAAAQYAAQLFARDVHGTKKKQPTRKR
jgi:hypothetical protein